MAGQRETASSAGDRPIGVLDSGVGGLSVMRHVRALLPLEDLLYVADQAHVPYGSRPAEQIRRLSDSIARFLLLRGAKLVVVACNTASAAALDSLRANFDGVPIVGMEPAVKPGAVQTQQGRIGILATPGTFGSRRYADLMARYAEGIVAHEDPCTGLVAEIEAGRADGPEARRILVRALSPMLAAGVDTFVLGCTHYPFALPLIRRLVGSKATIIDPAPAVARQVERVLGQRGLLTDRERPSRVTLFTSGNPERFAAVSQRLLGESFHVGAVSWQDGATLSLA
ncbi:MAG: glutamate racemase [Chloroflexota bacterium]|nr:MAG: glutamate racemase [Chloroflexota bacterium]